MSSLMGQLAGMALQAARSPDSSSSWRMAMGDGRQEDLYAVWNSVFEAVCVDSSPAASRGAAVDRSPRVADVSGVPGVSTGADAIGSGETFTGADVGDVGEAVTWAGVAAAADATGAAVADAVDATGAVSASCRAGAIAAGLVEAVGALGPATIGTSTSLCRGIPAELAFTAVDATHGATSSVVLANTTAASSEESVHVFVAPGTVAIAVHNPKLSVDAASIAAALNSAFEATSEITGQRSALQRFTLNGRVVYQRPDEAPPVPAGRIFAC